MDNDNINYIHSIDYHQVQDLIQNLPNGWIRIKASKLKPGQPPLFSNRLAELMTKVMRNSNDP